MAAAEGTHGLTATELAAACVELAALAGARVQEALPLAIAAGADDLLLVLVPEPGAGGHAKTFLHMAPGGSRARIATTAVRLPASAFARGPSRDLLQRELTDARLTRAIAVPGERRCALHFATAHGDRTLVVELFGARGLWALLDSEGHALVLSRAVTTAVRTLQPGDRYVPPPPSDASPSEPPPRFQAPVLPAIDAFFRPFDERVEARAEHERLSRAATRALQKATAKAAGIGKQLADGERANTLRATADWMLAYAHTVPRGATSMQVPDGERDGQTRSIELDPSRPVVVQARALYDKARALDDGRAIAERRLAAARAEIDALQPWVTALLAMPSDANDLAERLAPVRDALRALGALPKPAAAAPKIARPTAAESFRRFVSAEGYPIWVGKNSEQNDRLTVRVANGNDLWLHVGGGRAGSHVIVRLPKQKTASLETLLDAATLAVHFSKARGEARIEVVYTQRKHVRKPKGLPAGAVIPSHTKTITVMHDGARLRRLLDGTDDDADRIDG